MRIDSVRQSFQQLPFIGGCFDTAAQQAKKVEAFYLQRGIKNPPVIHTAGMGGPVVWGVVGIAAVLGALWFMEWWPFSKSETESKIEKLDNDVLNAPADDKGGDLAIETLNPKTAAALEEATKVVVVNPQGETIAARTTLHGQVVLGEYKTEKEANKQRDALLAKLNKTAEVGEKVIARSRGFNDAATASQYRNLLIQLGAQKDIFVKSKDDVHFVQFGAFDSSSAADESREKINKLLNLNVEHEGDKFYLLIGKDNKKMIEIIQNLQSSGVFK